MTRKADCRDNAVAESFFARSALLPRALVVMVSVRVGWTRERLAPLDRHLRGAQSPAHPDSIQPTKAETG